MGVPRVADRDPRADAPPREKTIVYTAPFDKCDRETDYRLAWAVFVERFGRA
jgi:hypothetical protein